MNWVPLRMVARPVMILLAIISVVVLIRGHNEPGGGFIGGLLGAAGFLVLALADSPQTARRLMHFSPATYLGTGVLLATGSGLFGLAKGQAFLTGQWWFALPGIGKIGSVLVFDLGVYLVIFGATLQILLGLLNVKEEERSAP